jgi:hypothetical protein
VIHVAIDPGFTGAIAALDDQVAAHESVWMSSHRTSASV